MDITLIISGGILLGCIIGLSWFAGTDAPFVPTKMDQIRQILKLAGVKRGRKFYELGSGDGRVVFAAATLGANAVGIEQSWLRVLYSRFKGQSIKKAKFLHGNIFTKEYSDADVIYIYLLKRGVAKLEGKLKKELKKGAVVITQTYHFPNWKPFKKLNSPRGEAGNFQLYRS